MRFRAVANLPRSFRKADHIRNDNTGVRESYLGLTMAKRTDRTTQTEMDERFLLQSLGRLKNPEQRYVFTLIADIISLGLAASKEKRKPSAAR